MPARTVDPEEATDVSRLPCIRIALLALVATCASARPVHAWPAGVEVFTGADCLRPSAGEEIDVALTRGATVLLPDGLPDGVERLAGLSASPLPPWCGAAWPVGRAPRDLADAITWRQAVRPEPDLLEGARLDPLVVAGRVEGRTEALVALAVRYYEGPRAGACLVVLGRHEGGDPDWGSLLALLRQPYLLIAEPDYALVRRGEDLRILVQASIRSDDVRSTRVDLGIPTERRLVRWLWQGSPLEWTRDRRAHGPDRLAGEAVAPAQDWPARPLEVRARLVARNGDLLDELRSTVAVWTGGLPTRPVRPSVTWRRLDVWGSDAPAFSSRLTSTAGAAEPWTPLRFGLHAWTDVLSAQGDAGARTVTLPVALDPGGAMPERRKRTNQALVGASLGARLSPELLFPLGTVHEGALGDDAVAGVLAPLVLASATSARDLTALAAMWPPEALVPLPLEADGGRLTFGGEAEVRAGARPVRASCEGSLPPSLLWESLLLGSAGVVVESPLTAATPRLLEGNVLARLLRPGMAPPQVPLLVADAWRPGKADADAGGLLNAAGYDWGPVSATDPHQLPGLPAALVWPGDAPLPRSPREHLRPWLEAGGALLVPAGQVDEFLEDSSAPPSEEGPPRAWRVGKGWLAEWDATEAPAGATRLALFLAARGGRGVTSTPSPDVRVLRNVVADGSRLLGAFAAPGSGDRRVTLTDGDHAADLGLSGESPAVACFAPTGPSLVASRGAFSIDRAPFLSAPDGCRVVVASLDGLALADSRSLLLFVDAPGPVELALRGAPGGSETAPLRLRALLPADGRLTVLAERGTQRGPDGDRWHVEAGELCTPILLSSREGLDVAQRRLSELVWGAR